MANITPENEISSRTNTFTALLYRIISYIECFREYASTIERIIHVTAINLRYKPYNCETENNIIIYLSKYK